MMTSLGLKETLCELVEKRLFDEEDDERAHGVLAVVRNVYCAME